MKAFISLMILSISLNSFAEQPKDSELKLKSCITTIYSAASKSKLSAKETLKIVSTGVKACRQQISVLKKEEAKQKKLANKAKRIQKLKEQLQKLSSN